MRKRYGLIFALLIAAIPNLSADVIPTLSSTTPLGANFTWSYSSNVTIDQRVQAGDFFTIYDFGNFTPGSNLQPANWVFSSSLLGTTPAQISPHDNASLLNLTWTYTGSTPIDGSALLGLFSVVTNTNQLSTADFSGQGTRNSGPNEGTHVGNIGRVSVPIPEVPALLPIISVVGAAFAAKIPAFLRRRKSV